MADFLYVHRHKHDKGLKVQEAGLLAEVVHQRKSVTLKAIITCALC